MKTEKNTASRPSPSVIGEPARRERRFTTLFIHERGVRMYGAAVTYAASALCVRPDEVRAVCREIFRKEEACLSACAVIGKNFDLVLVPVEWLDGTEWLQPADPDSETVEVLLAGYHPDSSQVAVLGTRRIPARRYAR